MITARAMSTAMSTIRFMAMSISIATITAMIMARITAEGTTTITTITAMTAIIITAWAPPMPTRRV